MIRSWEDLMRPYSFDADGTSEICALHDVADKLWAENERLRAQLDYSYMKVKNDKLKAENKRLRAVLREVIPALTHDNLVDGELIGPCNPPEQLVPEFCSGCAIHIRALAALEQSDG